MLALIPNLLGHTLFNWAIKWVSTNVISIGILFEPVGAAILAFYVFDETLSISQISRRNGCHSGDIALCN